MKPYPENRTFLESSAYSWGPSGQMLGMFLKKSTSGDGYGNGQPLTNHIDAKSFARWLILICLLLEICYIYIYVYFNDYVYKYMCSCMYDLTIAYIVDKICTMRWFQTWLHVENISNLDEYFFKWVAQPSHSVDLLRVPKKMQVGQGPSATKLSNCCFQRGRLLDFFQKKLSWWTL